MCKEAALVEVWVGKVGLLPEVLVEHQEVEQVKEVEQVVVESPQEAEPARAVHLTVGKVVTVELGRPVRATQEAVDGGLEPVVLQAKQEQAAMREQLATAEWLATVARPAVTLGPVELRAVKLALVEPRAILLVQEGKQD